MVTSRFQGQRWPSPTLTLDDAAAITRNWWDVEGEWSALESNQDQNFRVRTHDGRRFVLKVANDATPRADVEAQTAAVAHLASGSPGFVHPRETLRREVTALRQRHLHPPDSVRRLRVKAPAKGDFSEREDNPIRRPAQPGQGPATPRGPTAFSCQRRDP